MRRARTRLHTFPYDVMLLFPVLFLVGIGIAMVYSASSALALKEFGSDYYYLKKQTLLALLGIVALIVGRHFPYRMYRPLTYPLLVGSACLLIAIHISGLGVSVGGAKRWLDLGGFTFQPVELVRFAMVLYLAYSLSKKQEQVREFAIGFIPHAVVLGTFTALIVLQPDFGSAVLLAALTWIMMYVGGVRLLHLLSPLPILLPIGYFVMVNAAYRIKRLASFWDPWQYADGEGYQIVHSLMAFGTGGLWGTGIGKGYQKLFYLPEPHTDFIFSVIGEELGLLGVGIVLTLYTLIVWRGVIIARNASDAFGAYIAIGLTVALGLQVVVNMGVALGLLPTKGLPLPFLSYGGSSLLVSMAAVGVLMNIGAQKKATRKS